MTGETDPAGALGYAFSKAANLDTHHLQAALNASGVTGDHSGISHPIEISVPSPETSETPSIEQLAARRAGTPNGNMFRQENRHVL